MTTKQFAAILGFAFVAAVIAFNFGYGLLCLLGAAAGYYAARFVEGELDLSELQSRLSSGGTPAQPVAPPRPRPAAGPRVR